MSARPPIRQWVATGTSLTRPSAFYRLALSLLLTALAASTTLAAGPTAAPASPQPVATLKPVKALGQWMETQPFLRSGRIEYLRILNVHVDSPAAIAGVQDDMRIIHIQGVDVRGLTETAFAQTLESMPAAATLTLVVDGGLTPRTIVFPVTRDATPPLAAPPLPSTADGHHPMSDAEIKSRLGELKKACDRESVITSRAFRAEYAQAANENRRIPLTSHINPELLTQARPIAAELARQNVSLVCATAASERSKRPLFADTLIEGLDQTATHSPAHKAAVLEYLPQFPQLLATVERLQWTEEARPRIAELWKKLSRDTY